MRQGVQRIHVAPQTRLWIVSVTAEEEQRKANGKDAETSRVLINGYIRRGKSRCA